jgi:ribosomal protein S18 acetylase RimI-like enzyme
MANLDYETIFSPSQEDLEVIVRGIHQFNLSKVGEAIYSNSAKFEILARGENDKVIGGIRGKLMWDWLYIETLWVDESYRGGGIGTRLLAMAEEVAVSRGFYKCHLETTDFQSLDFYLKNGYEIFGKLEGKPAGSNWYYIKKDLAQEQLSPK